MRSAYLEKRLSRRAEQRKEEARVAAALKMSSRRKTEGSLRNSKGRFGQNEVDAAIHGRHAGPVRF